MKRFLFFSVLVALLAGCAGLAVDSNTVAGSNKVVSRTFDLTGFSRIEANNTAQVEVTRGEEFHVEIEVNDNLAPRLDVRARGDTLDIGLQNGSYSRVTLRAQVTMPELTGVKLDGASTLQGQLGGEALTLNLNGASQATLTGTAGLVSIYIDGSSQALLGDLDASEVEVNANGASRVEIKTSGEVRGKANGASIITVAGAPTSVDVQTEGASRVVTE